jgi:Icc-related predicted phosphoesterase
MTRILAFTDPHGEARALEGILRLAHQSPPDLIICAGDISLCGRGYESFVSGLAKLGQPVYFVTGNHDVPPVGADIAARFPYMRDIGDRLVEVAGLRLLGLADCQAYLPGGTADPALLAKVLGLEAPSDRAKPLVLVGHYPPWKSAIAGIRFLTAESGGSRLVLSIVEALQPKVMITGHYHQDFGREDRLGPTRLVNPGPAGSLFDL